MKQRPSEIFTGPRLIDFWRVGLDETNSGTAITGRVLLADASVDGGSAEGIVEMGPYDALDLMFFGTDGDGESANYLVGQLSQVLDAGDGTRSGYWMERIIAKGAAVFGTAQVSAAEAAAIDGLDENDRWADTISETLSFTGVQVYAPADNTVGWIRVPSYGAEYMSLQLDMITAATMGILVRRSGGDAQRA